MPYYAIAIDTFKYFFLFNGAWHVFNVENIYCSFMHTTHMQTWTQRAISTEYTMRWCDGQVETDQYPILTHILHMNM